MNQLSDICLEEIGFWYAGRNQLHMKPIIRSLSERKKKNKSQIYKKPVIRSVRGRKRKQNTEVQEHKQISGSTV